MPSKKKFCQNFNVLFYTLPGLKTEIIKKVLALKSLTTLAKPFRPWLHVKQFCKSR